MHSRFIRPFLLAIAMLFLSSASFAQIGVAITIAPPALPVYEQPVCPGDGYIWTPGYWGWGDDGYYWVPGTWVEAPEVGFFWTPGYWGWGGSSFVWYDGYWGLTVGFYGGINYGFGYFGHGFYGGYWNGGRFWYNRAYGHFGNNFHGNFYNRTYAGFSGRPGGASFNAHPPAQFAGNRGSTIHGTEAFPNRGNNNGFANREQQGHDNQQANGSQGLNRGQQSFDNRGQQQGFADRGAGNSGAVNTYNRGQSFGGSQPSYQHSAPQNTGGVQPSYQHS